MEDLPKFPDWFDHGCEFPENVREKLKQELLKIAPAKQHVLNSIIKDLHLAGWVYTSSSIEEKDRKLKYNYSHVKTAQELMDISRKASELSMLLSPYGKTSPYTLNLIEGTEIYGYIDQFGMENAFIKMKDRLGTFSMLRALSEGLIQLAYGLEEHPRTRGLLEIAEATKGQGCKKPRGSKDYEAHNFIDHVGSILLNCLEYVRVPEISEIQNIASIIVNGPTNFKTQPIKEWVDEKKGIPKKVEMAKVAILKQT